ncbi:IEC3 subunit of the ino80 complex, chromatin re-modelling domain-containing protein [Hirsutella rhossiliensis]|uniref:IEC3 subunit of the ino80 complex, chromatin re-modelling domain-containing protein n=1 Tax=Hirsutella rhossiliensis TaxID=111463 RepID=A0A9P8SCW3_9HYPO|nr:IEC3 subunit of the ino80 complex, chromatin re-modelling domain-containing protein [Hirsutella rhossiliensis]KAH0958068.1 IEC3 subunit of the ino80 complex, chromatin re-modelling domain-containing protein [Hirsutella rhossiliensis]
MDDSPTKAEHGVVAPADRRSSGYKSWKKKYRKMRIVFDHKMQQGEELHKREDKASATVKRLAVENDRLLDLLLEVNNSPQIPPERRIDLSLAPPSNPEAPALQLDRGHAKESAFKRLEQLLSDVPHSSYSAAKEAHSPYMADLAVPEGEAHPANFLSADDVDNYIYAVDTALDPDSHLPSLGPRAHPGTHPVSHPHLKNPTSVTNWLRKHAPKIFLQDSEHASSGGAGGGGAGGDADDAESGAAAASAGGGAHHQTTGGRKSRGGTGGGGNGSRADRGSKANPKGKRANAAASRLAAERGPAGDWDASMDDEGDFATTPGGRGGKRKRDDDPGYRPGGSTSRPSKKKRKSEGGESTPSARRSKKEKDKDKDAVVSKDD